MSEHCEHCGASINKYWHRLTPGIVNSLVKFRRAVIAKGENSVHLQKDMYGDNELTRMEYNNFQKLRYHGLAVKTQEKNGCWLLTHRGAEFAKGNLAVPIRVQSFRNRVVDHDQHLVTIREVIGSTPYFEQDHETETAKEVDLIQASLI